MQMTQYELLKPKYIFLLSSNFNLIKAETSRIYIGYKIFICCFFGGGGGGGG
jgi:hypothetical protein